MQPNDLETSQDSVSGDRDTHTIRRPVYRLNVQGVIIDSRAPTIEARDAIRQAGLDPDTGWIIVLKVRGEPKEVITLDTVIDLRRPGIEKLRLTPKQIDNGEAVPPRRLEFPLLPKDDAYLNALGLRWETILDNGRRWLLLRGYRLPHGYTAPETDIAIEVPVSYPGAQLDMFFCFPHLHRLTGQPIPQTEMIETILGAGFQRWSRHRPGNSWNSASDCVATHVALVEEALTREVDA